MIEITLRPTYAIIENYTEVNINIIERLTKYLSEWDPNKFTVKFTAIISDDNMMVVPMGISKNTLEYYFPNAKFHDERDEFDEYRTVNRYGLVKGPRDSIQNNAINFLSKKYGQKYLCLQTGQGKTYCAINYCHKCKKFPLIIVDQTSLILQWINNIKKYTTVSEAEIFTISGKDSVNKLMKMNDKELSKFKFVLAYHKTLAVLYQEDKLEDLFNHCKFGLKIFDEAHVYWNNIFYIDTCSNTETIYLSATPKLVNINANKIYQRMYKGVIKYKTNITHKYFNVALINVNFGCTSNDIVDFYNKRGFDNISYAKYLMNEGFESFKNVITDTLRMVMSNRFNRKKKIALMFKMIDQTEIACNIIEEYLKTKDSEMTVGVLTGKTKLKDKKEILSKDIICTTDSSFSKAIDIPGLEILINFVPISCTVNNTHKEESNTTRINQITGRLREIEGKEVFFVDIIDQSVSGLVTMSKNRIRYYKTIAKKIYNMNGYGCRKE